MYGFLGMRGSGDWGTDVRPMNWRQNILYLYPNGMAPLTAIISMLSSNKVDDPQFHWWTQSFAHAAGNVNGIFTLPDLSAAYAGGGVTGNMLYVSIGNDDANRCIAGQQILMRHNTDERMTVIGKIVNVTTAGLIGILHVRLLEDDDNSPDNDLSDAESYIIAGTINPEGGVMPDPIALDPIKHYNYTQIFRNSLALTRTALRTKLRTDEQYQKAKKECLEMHSIEMELAFWWGIRSERIGDNSKPERTTMGLLNFIRQNAPLNCDNYSRNADYNGQLWTQGGAHWLDTYLEQIHRFGDSKFCLCGSGVVLAIQRLVQANATYNISKGEGSYGIKVMNWMTPFGDITLKTHPLFSLDPATRNMAVFFEPKDLGYRFIDDTTFYGDNNKKDHPEGYGSRRVDGKEEEFLTEAGLEMHFPVKCGILTGFGVNNP